ncbi:ATP-binding protein [Paraburkholderia caledonica]|uniref:histidine kinase n=1 Tax=Paraburkholderia caledonica TaxID=134536 RepID=A0AB73IN68_9BURK|nr:signal transduction histidine kinase [Paraburkholderia caledonica]
MDLADFIEQNLAILVRDWVEYAREISREDRLVSEERLSEEQLRNSAVALLSGIAADMRTHQNAFQQLAKSRGAGAPSGFNDAAHQHADDRLAHGFNVNEVVAEFRALRATVLRHWQESSPEGPTAFQAMIRFNEAIDQMLAESVRKHVERSTHIRDLFASVLAHDLRSPLGAIVNSPELLLHDEGLSANGVRAVANVQRGSRRMKRMIEDLLIFARTRFGKALPVSCTSQDLGRICSDAAEEVSATWPEADITVTLRGDLRGSWDGGRLGQLVTNLLVNAVRYGSGPVTLAVAGKDGGVTLIVGNQGNPIPSSALPTLFDPLTRASALERSGTAAGMGLGLYICRGIASVHQGTIGVESTETGTFFTVRLPSLPARNDAADAR